MKTVAVVGCLDTKYSIFRYIVDALRAGGCDTLMIDTSLLPHAHTEAADYSVRDLLSANHISFERFQNAPKAERVRAVRAAIGPFAAKLYGEGRLHAMIGGGGAQNSHMAASAMWALPFGVPKVLFSCFAGGSIPFEELVGRTDVIIVPTVADVVEMNSILQVPLDLAVRATLGMLSGECPPQTKRRGHLAGLTCAGVTYQGTLHAAQLLEAQGLECVFFHGVTAGGYAMEDFVVQGRLDGCLDLCIHDVLVEAIGYYYNVNTRDHRLERLADSGLPAVVSLSGMDVIDISQDNYDRFPAMPGWGHRQIFHHNETALHIKALPEEIHKAGPMLVERLNRFRGPLCVVMPNRGFRANTQKGEELYDPEVDRLLMDYVANGVRGDIRVREIDCNANDPLFSETVAKEYLRLI